MHTYTYLMQIYTLVCAHRQLHMMHTYTHWCVDMHARTTHSHSYIYILVHAHVCTHINIFHPSEFGLLLMMPMLNHQSFLLSARSERYCLHVGKRPDKATGKFCSKACRAATVCWDSSPFTGFFAIFLELDLTDILQMEIIHLLPIPISQSWAHYSMLFLRFHWFVNWGLFALPEVCLPTGRRHFAPRKL